MPNNEKKGNLDSVFKYSFEQAQRLVEFADSKANILLTIHTLVITIISTAAFINLDRFASLSEPYNWAVYIFGLVFYILIIISIVMTGLVIIPRDAVDEKSLFYYKTISNFESSNHYFKELKNKTTSEISESLAHQSYNVSLIAVKKMNKVRISVQLMFGYITFLILFILVFILGIN